jgi:hypothetical protein
MRRRYFSPVAASVSTHKACTRYGTNKEQTHHDSCKTAKMTKIRICLPNQALTHVQVQLEEPVYTIVRHSPMVFHCNFFACLFCGCSEESLAYDPPSRPDVVEKSTTSKGQLQLLSSNRTVANDTYFNNSGINEVPIWTTIKVKQNHSSFIIIFRRSS